MGAAMQPPAVRQRRMAVVRCVLVAVLVRAAAASCRLPWVEEQRRILMDLYKATDGPNWGANSLWNSTECYVCNWFGVECSKTMPGRVDVL